MSQQYENYLFSHRLGLKQSYAWLKNNLPEIFEGLAPGIDIEHQIILAHDSSKNTVEEYDAYDSYWYGGNKSYGVVHEYDIAWLHHIHNNPHHWQHWLLFKDDDHTESITIFEMPLNYILEMICDWWSFSWTNDDLNRMFNWYDERKDNIKFHDKTRKTVDSIFSKMKIKLKELEEKGDMLC